MTGNTALRDGSDIFNEAKGYLTIGGDAVIDSLSTNVYTSSTNGAIRLTVSDDVRIGSMTLETSGSGDANKPAIYLNGGYYGTDPALLGGENEEYADYLYYALEPTAYAGQGDWAFDGTAYPWRIRESVTLTGTVAPRPGVITYTVSNAPDDALIVAARYANGVLTSAKTVTVSGNTTGTIMFGGSGSTYKLFLFKNARSLSPLCESWSSD